MKRNEKPDDKRWVSLTIIMVHCQQITKHQKNETSIFFIVVVIFCWMFLFLVWQFFYCIYKRIDGKIIFFPCLCLLTITRRFEINDEKNSLNWWWWWWWSKSLHFFNEKIVITINFCADNHIIDYRFEWWINHFGFAPDLKIFVVKVADGWRFKIDVDDDDDDENYLHQSNKV